MTQETSDWLFQFTAEAMRCDRAEVVRQLCSRPVLCGNVKGWRAHVPSGLWTVWDDLSADERLPVMAAAASAAATTPER